MPEITGARLFAEPAVKVEIRTDGAMVLENPMPLEPYARCIGEFLEHWGRETPNASFLLERGPDGQWQGVTYGQALTKVRQIAGWLLRHHKRPDHPVCVMTDNGVEHGLIMLACMHVGIPYTAISPAYSLVSKDHAKLKNLIQRLEPEFIYVGGSERYLPAIKSIEGLHTARFIVSDTDPNPADALRFSELLAGGDDAAVQAAFEQVGPDTIAKILFTSGSTGYPKGVINTQRMMCASQQAKLQLWPFLREHPPVLLDWLPWNHTFGGNHNFNIILVNGGTLYLDSGKPLPGMFDQSVQNLRDVAPTLYLNVPRAFDMLLPALRSDAELRRKFFSNLQVIFYAAAALPQHLWDGLIELSKQELGYAVPMVTAWGSTETSPLATDCHYQADRSGVIGLPVPGVSIKLVPSGDKLEVRVKGPNITPGYFKQAEETVKAFDEEGFYRIGDAAKFADPANPSAGLMFDGRVSEDFKLTTATWVSVGALRVKGIEVLAPAVQDIVVTGHDRDSVGFLIFPNVAACRKLAGLPDDAPLEQVTTHPAVVEHIVKGLKALRAAGTGSSTFADRAVLLNTPPSVDAGEITDKGYINQSAVLKARVELVEKLYGTDSDPRIIRL
ncbi:MAG TPA: feruloyl-CoA synthase [Pusillimonas sp.]|uniref:feruloyl-CoA synthase n=1 Tax=Pusillimonas sp. TaxID=3040095 RepID=UPI002C6FC35A|nr:feruloyl-CoA synthase [Pusillimonas sp.]HUH87254.1 feruloyl-CoA synthase [Pusillimonas sp.]